MCSAILLIRGLCHLPGRMGWRVECRWRRPQQLPTGVRREFIQAQAMTQDMQRLAPGCNGSPCTTQGAPRPTRYVCIYVCICDMCRFTFLHIHRHDMVTRPALCAIDPRVSIPRPGRDSVHASDESIMQENKYGVRYVHMTKSIISTEKNNSTAFNSHTAVKHTKQHAKTNSTEKQRATRTAITERNATATITALSQHRSQHPQAHKSH